MRKITLVIYYCLISVFLLTCTIFIPFQQAQKESDIYDNARLSELKVTKKTPYLDEKSEEVNAILIAGNALLKTEYKSRSGKYGLLASAVVLVLTLILTFTRPRDAIWIGAFFTVLYAYGSMTTEYYAAIALLALITYYIKKRIARTMNPRTQ